MTGTVWKSACGLMELRLGDWRDVLQDVNGDAVITDPPYSIHTHRGHDAGASQRTQIKGQAFRPIDYPAWDQADVIEAVHVWDSMARGWIVSMCDDWLITPYRMAAGMCNRYHFAPVHWYAFRPRLMGDGPTNCFCYIMTSRPRTVEFSRWGCLDGRYDVPQDRGAKIGGKPLGLMRALVRDYSKRGNLVIDPCAGHGTTLLAAAMEGRRAIGAERDPDAFAQAVARLDRPYTADMFADTEPPAPAEQLTIGEG
jgi:site-specific DNA-methyltransferase (adenine-specific)